MTTVTPLQRLSAIHRRADRLVYLFDVADHVAPDLAQEALLDALGRGVVDIWSYAYVSLKNIILLYRRSERARVRRDGKWQGDEPSRVRPTPETIEKLRANAAKGAAARQPTEYRAATCAQCGEVIPPPEDGKHVNHKKSRKFCSVRCAVDNRVANHVGKTAKCVCCGESFKPAKSTRRFCSKKCSGANRRKSHHPSPSTAATA